MAKESKVADEPEATPAAQAHAEKLGVDLSKVEGSGSGGTITKADVEAAAGDKDEEGAKAKADEGPRMSSADTDLHEGTAKEQVTEMFQNAGQPTDMPKSEEITPANPGQSPASIQHVADIPLPPHAKPQQMIPAGETPGRVSPNPNA